MELSSDVLRPFLVWGLRSDNESVIGNRRLHLLESSETLFTACLSFCTLEEMKLWSVILSPGQMESQVDTSWGLYVQRLGTHDQKTRLIFLFLASRSFLTKCNSSHLIRFCMEMFKYSEFDLEQTTTNSTIIVYISLDFLLWQTLPFAAIEQNTASESFVLIAGSFLLQFTKLVIGLSKSVMGAAIKNMGHPGRRFLAASPPRARDHRGFAPRFHQTEKPNRQTTQASSLQEDLLQLGLCMRERRRTLRNWASMVSDWPGLRWRCYTSRVR